VWRASELNHHIEHEYAIKSNPIYSQCIGVNRIPCISLQLLYENDLIGLNRLFLLRTKIELTSPPQCPIENSSFADPLSLLKFNQILKQIVHIIRASNQRLMGQPKSQNSAPLIVIKNMSNDNVLGDSLRSIND
jgi:hypothetical protein